MVWDVGLWALLNVCKYFVRVNLMLKIGHGFVWELRLWILLYLSGSLGPMPGNHGMTADTLAWLKDS